MTTPVWQRWIWLVPAVFLAIFLVIPLAQLATTFARPAGVNAVIDPTLWRIAGLAAVQAALSTMLALFIGLPIANVATRYRYRGRSIVQALVTVPFVLPTVVVALGFRSLIGTSAPSAFVLVVIAHAYINLAVMVRVVGARWQQHDPRFEESARLLGARPWTTFTTVTLPMLRGAIATAAAITFVFCFTSLGIVVVLGDASTRTLETQVLRRTSLLLDFPGAGAAAVMQLLLVGIVLLMTVRIARKAPSEPTRARHLLPLPRDRRGRIAVRATALGACVIVITPIASLLIASVSQHGALTLQWWAALGSIDAGTTRLGSPLVALGISLRYALLTAVIAGLIGGAAAIAILGTRLARATTTAAMLPLGISAATLGLGTLLAFGRPPLDLRDTGLLIPLAHSLVAIPLVIAVAAPALRAADARILAVAATLGARPTRAFFSAYGPVLRIVMIAAAGLAAAVSLGEFGAASFLARAGNPTVPMQVVRLLGRPGEQSYGAACALAVVLIVLTFTLVLAVDRFGRRTIGVTP